MARSNYVTPSVDKKYTVASPAGIAAVKERIQIIAGQRAGASNDSVARIYEAASEMLNAMLEAGAEGISTSVLLAKARAKVPLELNERDEALHLLRGHMALVRETVSNQK